MANSPLSSTLALDEPLPVLFKGARVTAHLLQNLALLALPNGSAVETSYGSRWIASNADGDHLPCVGETVLVVLSSPPYGTFVPVRFASLEAVEARGSFYSFRMDVGPYLAVEEIDRIGEVIQRWDPELRPREKFVARGLGGEEIAVANDEPEVALAWKSLTTRLESHKDYENALFARLVSAPNAVLPGEPGHIRVEVAARATVRPTAQLELREGSASLIAQEQQNGMLDLVLTAETSENVVGSLRIIADELIAPALPINATVNAVTEVEAPLASEPVEAEPPPPAGHEEATTAEIATDDEPPVAAPPLVERAVDVPAASLVLGRADVRRLVRDASALSSAELARRLGELAVEAAPDDVELAAQTARLLAGVERWEEAAALLNRFEPAALPPDSLYDRFVADCATGRSDDANRLLTRLDFETDEAFRQLQRALRFLSDHTAVRLGLQLVSETLGEARSLDLFHTVRDRITAPRDVFEFAQAIQYVSEHEALDLLLRHTSREPTETNLLELLVEIASRIPGNQKIGPQLIALGALKLESGDVQAAFDLLKTAETEARTEERLDLAESVADALAKVPGRRDDAVMLLVAEVDTALSVGLLERAAGLARRAIGIAAGDDGAEAIAREALDRTERALTESEPLRSLLTLQREARLANARKQIRGRRLAIVGGQEDELTAQSLRASFGFSDVRWFPSEKHKPLDSDIVRKLDADKTVVVVLTERIGHSRSTPIIKHCDTHDIPCILSRLGAPAIDEALLAYGWRAPAS